MQQYFLHKIDLPQTERSLGKLFIPKSQGTLQRSIESPTTFFTVPAGHSTHRSIP